MDLAFVLAIGLVAGTLSGIVGFGASIMLMPVLVISYGPLAAVPIMAVASIMANLSRVMVWWREVDWRACAAYSATGIPAAALGARTLLALPPRVVEVTLGAFFLAMIPARRWLAARELKLQRWHLALIGLVIGFLTGIVVTTGPLSVPVFLAYGLAKGAFLATEAAGSLGIYVAKSAVFRSFGALPWDAIAKGLVIGASLMAGSYLAKRFVLKLPAERFRLLMDGMMAVSGIAMLWAAIAPAS
ncbi:MAG TPA: sulfite exporter TauE/SafE family protein [Casimicrobiaceae bacterium]